MAKIVRAEKYHMNRLMNLLAIIHRDGGHYVAQHDLAKACDDAETVVLSAHHKLDELSETEQQK